MPVSNGRAHAGFSLIELVIVLAVLGVVATIAVPRYAHSLARYHADAAANRIIADLDYARSEARRRSIAITVSFDTTNETYQVSDVPDIDHGTVPYTIDLSMSPYTANIGSVNCDATTVTDLTTEIVFNEFGVPDSGGLIVVLYGSETRTIMIDDVTGKASVQ